MLGWLSTDNMIRIGFVILVVPTLIGIVLTAVAFLYIGVSRLLKLLLKKE